MADIPLCKSCKQPYVLMRETTEWYEFGCERCKVGHVFSKPASTAAGRYRARLQHELEIAKRIRQWEGRPKHFFIDSTKTSKGVN